MLKTVLFVVATAFLVATAKAEEKEDIRFFGASYQTYIQQTKMFIPFLFRGGLSETSNKCLW